MQFIGNVKTAIISWYDYCNFISDMTVGICPLLIALPLFSLFFVYACVYHFIGGGGVTIGIRLVQWLTMEIYFVV